nr:2A [Tupaia hepatovirus A]
SSVDDFKTDEEKKFEEELSNEILPLEKIPRNKFPYRSLRMKVGEQRLKYAQEELKNGLFSQGNLVVDFAIYEKDIGNYTFRGFGFKGKVCRFTTPSWIEKNVKIKSGTFCLENIEGWEEVQSLPSLVAVLQRMVNIPDWLNARFPYCAIQNSDFFDQVKKEPIFSKLDLAEIEILFNSLIPTQNSTIRKIARETGVTKVSSE